MMIYLIFVIKFSEVIQVYANCHRSMPHPIDIDLLSMPFKKLNSQTELPYILEIQVCSHLHTRMLDVSIQ
jgi:hypothetical protein